jgi:hypothetical protein
MWSEVLPDDPDCGKRIAGTDSVLKGAYDDSMSHISEVSFQQLPSAKEGAVTGRTPSGQEGKFDNKDYYIEYETAANTTSRWGESPVLYSAMMVHELGHVGTSTEYHLGRHFKDAESKRAVQWAELDVAPGGSDEDLGQRAGAEQNKLDENRESLRTIVEKEKAVLGENVYPYLTGGPSGSARLDYMLTGGMGAHYETVLTEMMMYLAAEGKQKTKTYRFMSRMLKEAIARRRKGGTEVSKVDPNAWFYEVWKW